MPEYYEPTPEEWAAMHAKEAVLMITAAVDIATIMKKFEQREVISVFELCGECPLAFCLLVRNRCIDFCNEMNFGMKLTKYGQRYLDEKQKYSNKKDDLIRAGLNSDEAKNIIDEQSKKEVMDKLNQIFGVNKNGSQDKK